MNKTSTADLKGLALFLFHDGLLDYSTAKSAITLAKENNMTLTQYLVEKNILSSEVIHDYCTTHFNLPLFDVKRYDANIVKDGMINLEMILHYRMVPLYKDNDGLHIGMSDPTDYPILSTISVCTGYPIHPVLMSEVELDKYLQIYSHQPVHYAEVQMALAKMPLQEQLPIEAHLDEPIIHLVDQLIEDAITKHVSDIHLEPFEHSCRIRFRQDGLLYEVASLPSAIALQMTSRLKVLANLNIAEKRLAQDGRIQFKFKNKIDIRINTCPTLFGEKVVLRLLNPKGISLSISELGFSNQEKEMFLEKLSEPQGLILVTGPTGSGKTTTLYSALQHLNHVSKNIISIEDPVEIEVNGINQININSKIGLDFPKALRSLLRQDPDVMMVGEIRDTETAEIATQAAMTGHLVLSTLHTNSAFETILRLQTMISQASFLNATSLIIAQRLIRKLCGHCKQLAAEASHSTFYQYTNTKQGCEQCHQGYKGRAAIFEFLPMTPALLTLLVQRTLVPSAINNLLAPGTLSLWEAGLKLVREGITSMAELTRVISKPQLS